MHLEKEKKKDKPVSYKTKRTEVIRSRNAHNSENSAKRLLKIQVRWQKEGFEKRWFWRK